MLAESKDGLNLFNFLIHIELLAQYLLCPDCEKSMIPNKIIKIPKSHNENKHTDDHDTTKSLVDIEKHNEVENSVNSLYSR